ncbi:TRAP transporter substrate-binding protein [Bacillus canaveralius]|uniref:TRAP transporter substrate-binding protein n=1 Tax=Bacillus canaveralius TaxID=1403243 RepID=UPI001C8C64F5|nr:TRAP transporter substrate-binding protein [Bacillus canaveralius]
MKNKLNILSIILIVSLLFISACSSNENASSGSANKDEGGQEEYVMKVATPTSNDPQTHAMDLFKETLEKKTGGKMKVELYPSSQLGSNDQMLQQLSAGTIHGLLEPTAFLGGFAEILTVVDMPYLWPDVQVATEYLNGDGMDLFEPSLKEKGLTALSYYEYGPRIILLNDEVKNIDDFSGQKIRVMGAPVLVDEINAWGGTGVAMGVPELYTALEQGTIDGLESASMFFYSGKYYEHANYLLKEPNGAEVTIFMANNKWLDSLPDDLKTAVREAATEITEDVHTYARTNDEDAIKKMEEEGLTVIKSTEELHKQLTDASQSVYDEFVKRVPGSQEIMDKIREKFPLD